MNSVPAEIRVRMIDANSVLDIQDIKRKWTCMGTDKASCNDEHVDGKVVTMDELNMMVKNDENLRVSDNDEKHHNPSDPSVTLI